MRKPSAQWNIYRTRFLIKAKQLTEAMSFIDALGREHRGDAGDYLVESSDGTLRIAPRTIFEDVYVTLEGGLKSRPRLSDVPKTIFATSTPYVSRQQALQVVEKRVTHS